MLASISASEEVNNLPPFTFDVAALFEEIDEEDAVVTVDEVVVDEFLFVSGVI